jgi:hypothetical protein
MNSFWNERYSGREFVYGELPNVFFAETLSSFEPGTIILPCDGEGRNAVYAATALYPNDTADIVALIYTHLPRDVREKLHHNVIKWLKPGGKLILETFCPDQLKNNSGGPKEIDMLYTKELLTEDFKNLNIEFLEYASIQLNEGKFHEGPADVIRMIATKL